MLLDEIDEGHQSSYEPQRQQPSEPKQRLPKYIVGDKKQCLSHLSLTELRIVDESCAAYVRRNESDGSLAHLVYRLQRR